MEEAEKMEALKKAFAEVILNTAIEAAARIMVSERNAVRLERDLWAAKEEALNVVVRAKEMMDCKCAEAERSSLNQKKIIKELEAQLSEAENVITGIKDELKEVQAELTKMKIKSNQVKPLDEQSASKSIASHRKGQSEGDIVIDTKAQLRVVEPSNRVLLKPVDSGGATPSKFDMKGAPLSCGKAIECFRIAPHRSSQSGFLNGSPRDVHDTGSSDLSFRMRSKEPDLYRSGCTPKRIRATLPLQGEISNQYMEESLIVEDEAVQGLCTLAHHKEENVIMTVKSRMEKLPQNCVRSDKAVTRISNRKRKRRFRRTKTVLSTNNAKSSHKTSTPSSCETYSCMDSTNMVKSIDTPARIIEEEACIKSELHCAQSSSLNMIEDDPFSAPMKPHNRNAKLGSFESSPNEYMDSRDKSISKGQKHRHVENLMVSVCTVNPKTDHVASVNPNNEDCINCEMANEAHPRSANDKFLKYTFDRKRKKRSLSSANENASPERYASNRILDEKQRVGPELQKSCLSVKSSRESRRLMQVARQLISLSEKRHWQ